jgi:hypothetical protein
MVNPTSFYNKLLAKHSSQAKALYKQLVTLSTLRLLVFIAAIAGIYLFFDHKPIAIGIAIVGIALFLFLLNRYVRIKANHQLEKALININENELSIGAGNFHDKFDGNKFQNPKHFFSLDIDLFGRGSFFQFINRTQISESTTLLAKSLLANNILSIEERQEAIKELSQKPEWRQHYQATASLIKTETPAKTIINWLQSYTAFLPAAAKWLPLLFSVNSIAVLALTIFSVIEVKFLGYWFLLGLFVSARFVKNINALSANTDKVKDTFKQYALLLDAIEKEQFSSELLQEKQQAIQQKSEKASVIFKRFSGTLESLDNRNNLIWAFLGNGFFLIDIYSSFRIEKWIATYANKVGDWFEVVSFFGAYNSLGNYGFNHPDFTYPKIESSSSTIIKAEDLGHPLLAKEKRISSNLQIDNEQFFIITGANMAGKSTFLRTVSLHIVMANIGLPICATSSVYRPVKLITSMRTTDSLTDDSSYFFSELTRLKFIVDQIVKEPYFIILDEILKGTNSTDKAIGSKKFLEKLVAGSATGIIATHDLSLCEVEKTLEEVKNYYFDAQIINDELFFDYKLKQGICQNMNASFLLKKMEII